jgi:hypothetical protein
MRAPAWVYLVCLLGLSISCERRNFDRCVPGSNEFQCEPGYFCMPMADDPSGVGQCMAAECATGQQPSGCPADRPICTTQGRCTGCQYSAQCAAAHPDTPFCGNQQCVECLTSTDCGSNLQRPVCDATTHTCRPCALHGECKSGACVKDQSLSSLPATKALMQGMCVPSSRMQVLDGGACTSCSLQSKIDQASADLPYIVVSNYAPVSRSPVTIAPILGLPELHIISASADLSPSRLSTNPAAIVGYQKPGIAAVTAVAGASVTLEGLLLSDSYTALLCDSTRGGAVPPQPTSIKLVRSLVGNSSIAVETHAQCHLVIDQSWIGRGPAAVTQLKGGNFTAMNLDSTEFDIINSVFVGNGQPTHYGGITVTDTQKLQRPGHIVSSTFDRQEPDDASNPALAVDCAPGVNLIIFNTVFVNSSSFMPTTGPKTYVARNCRTAQTFADIATDEPLPIVGMSGPNVISPVTEAALFVDAAGRNLHLGAGAPPAVRTSGVTSYAGVVAPSVDMDGVTRGPTGVSIGAFEAAH